MTRVFLLYVQNTTKFHAQYSAHIPSKAIFILLNVFLLHTLAI